MYFKQLVLLKYKAPVKLVIEIFLYDRGVRDDIEQEDVEEAYYRYMEENPMAGVLADEQEELNVEYDNDGNIIYVEKNKV